jgi:hypothetical protein
MLVLLSVWSVPVAALASLLSWNTVKETVPRLAKFLDKSPRLRGLVQTTLPSLALVIFNNLLPFFLEALSIFQGLQARSWIELSQLKKYHISLVLTTLLVPVSRILDQFSPLIEANLTDLDESYRSLHQLINCYKTFHKVQLNSSTSSPTRYRKLEILR